MCKGGCGKYECAKVVSVQRLWGAGCESAKIVGVQRACVCKAFEYAKETEV